MNKSIQLSEEELQKLKDFRKERNQITSNLGQVDIQKALLEGQRNMILEDLAKLQEAENTVGKELQDKYGDGNINLDTGEFTKSE